MPDAGGAVTTISTCNFLSEYSAVGPVVAGAGYQFTATGNAYITVREGSPSGAVIAAGYSPVTAAPTINGTLYAHWNANDQCGFASNCETTTVQLFLNCMPPTAQVTAVDDCDNNQFSLNVNITSLGDAGSLDLIYSVNGGSNQTVSGVSTGIQTIGPFTVGQSVNLMVAHDSDPACNLTFNGLVSNNTCPIIVNCGGAPLDQNYCYVNNDNNHWLYQSSNGMPLIMIFSAGSIESSSWDHIRIYNGTSNAAPLLYQNGTGSTNLTGVQVIGTNGALYMEATSDGSGSCQSGSYNEWFWQVGCLDCSSPTATFTVVPDCDSYTFMVDVNITELGSDATLDITEGGLGNILATATAPGVYTVGPFTANIPVVITLSNSENSLCNVSSPSLVNALCPQIVQCGGAPVDGNYCYGNSDSHAWSWQSSTGDALILIFSAGSIESNSFDHIRIYNGNSNTAPLLYENASGATNLTGVQVIAGSGMMYMEMSSDGYVSCASGSYNEWFWQIGCLDCTSPTATYTVVPDCDSYTFSVDVNITELGSDATLDITEGGLGNILATATAPGIYTVGPFTANIPVVITLSNSENSLCNVSSTPLVNALCPQTIQCGGAPIDGNYCYGNNDSHAWSWQSSTGDALILIFSAGSIESSSWDHIRIFNGPDNNSPLIYQNGTGATDLTGVQAIAGSGMMYMEMSSDGSGSCASGSYNEWFWQIGCLDCTSPTATFSVVTDCPNMQYSVAVNITDMGSDPVLDITNNNGALPVVATAPGTYTVGPFPAGSATVVTLENDMNSLCNIQSQPLTNPLCPTVIQCSGALYSETYCYINNDNHTWHWQSAGGQPLAMEFSAGTIESSSWDHLRIYDGPNNQSPLLFDHTQTSQFNLAGLLLISTGSHIYMENSSDGSVSCASGNQVEWAWTLGCLDCTNPGASYSVVEDCIHHSFSVAVSVDSLGSGSFVRIANSLSNDTLTNIPAGITMVGPFPMDSTVTLTVLNETNDLCRVYSPAFTANSVACVDTVCDATAYEYCYTNLDTAWFAYQGMPGVPLTVKFLWGRLLANDFVQIFNGLAPLPNRLIWQGNLNGNMEGFAVNTTQGFSTMLVRVVSDGAYSCATGEASPPLHWVMECGAVGVEELSANDFVMYPNPSTGELNLRMPANVNSVVQLRVTDLAGRTVHAETFTSHGEVSTVDLHNLQSGNYLVTITTNDWVKAQQLQIIR
ncbi:MAG TPA: T9SS type A sorting domain-containing protein [Flavobacteriales bacterium]|nr:T9SS type A sorting domain-containing protein [Flavobacteriales bacterium]